MHLEVDIESIVNEYSPSYGIIHDHLLLLANNLLGNNETILLLFMMDIGEYHADIQRNCEAISLIRAKHGGRYCLSIPMNEA